MRTKLAQVGVNTSTSSGVWADPMWSIDREPREEDHTTWTAVAPDAVFTVLTYGLTPTG